VTDVDRQAVRLQPRLDLDRVVSDPRHAGTPFRPDTSAQED